MVSTENVHIRKICREQRIVSPDAGTEEQWRRLAQRQHQPRQESRAVIIEPVFSQSRGPNVPVSIEYRKHRPILEYPNPLLDGRKASRDVKLGLDADFSQSELRLNLGSVRPATLQVSRKGAGIANSLGWP